MATAPTVPGQVPHPRPEAVPRSGLLEWFTTVDHKKIGLLYLVTSGIFLLIGGLEALLMRTQLAVPSGTVLGPDQYNAVFTMHGTTMVFLVVMPMLLGFSNYFVPLMIGARDMAFPRLNALSYWLLLFGGIVLYFSFLTGNPPDTGWFSYAPLTERPYSMSHSPDYWAIGLLITSIGTIATGLNLVVTVAKLRTRGMTWGRVPPFAWMSLITGVLILGAMPSLTAAQVMLVFDRTFGAHFFQGGGDPVLWQHLFWFFGHPEVYIMVLPAFGMLSEIIPVFSRQPIFGYKFIVGSGMVIAVYSFMVWAHHMFAVGLGTAPDAFFGAASMLIAVPTGIKIFSWLGTMWGGRIRLTTSMLFCIGFIAMFVIGGVSGVQFAVVPVDWQLTDTYYVVAHMHYVLFGGTYFGIMGGIYFWFPKVTGRLLSERLGKWHFWTTLIGFNVTFFPMHIVGLMGMPRRVFTYPDRPWWGTINFIETVGAFIMAISVLILVYNVAVSLARGEIAGPNPWNAWTLEWATSSPPPVDNFSGPLPGILSERPLWDARYNAERVAAAPRAIPTAPDGDLGEGARGFIGSIPLVVIGIAAFIFSEIFFFGSLILSYLDLRHRGTGPGPEVLDVLVTAIFSVALFASSGTIHLAEKRLHRGDRAGFRRWWLATIALGLIFIAGQALEYRRLYAEGVKMSSSPFSSAFFTLTGFHGFHVIVGLIALGSVAYLAFSPRFRADVPHRGVRAVALYWHFVDVVWVAVFSVVYLLTLL